MPRKNKGGREGKKNHSDKHSNKSITREQKEQICQMVSKKMKYSKIAKALGLTKIQIKDYLQNVPETSIQSNMKKEKKMKSRFPILE